MLIMDGYFKYTRNPNYLAEMIIYLSFAALCHNWIAYAIIIYSWVTVLIPGMIKKDKSLMKKP